ncbi:MAG TPA: hypothetical protein VGO80_09930 [Solirubrobacteraceae bacterium]|jgi:hypothetical protein|nr:hypothetical protein [Solirubrobacteraceae bacterium]
MSGNAYSYSFSLGASKRSGEEWKIEFNVPDETHFEKKQGQNWFRVAEDGPDTIKSDRSAGSIPT